MDLTVTPFTARDGENLALYNWQAARRTNAADSESSDRYSGPAGIVLIVHGLGEHAGRYEGVAQLLTQLGFAVRGYDQRGHGRSDGQRGALPDHDVLLEDLAEMVDEARLHGMPFPTTAGELEAEHAAPKHLPLILLGHSLGGLVAARFVALNLRPVEGLVLSSPALDPGLNFFQKLLLSASLKLMPSMSVNNGLNPQHLSRDPQVVKAYLEDRLVHNKISPRLGHFIATAGSATIAAAANWRTPTLLMYAGADKLVNPEGSRRFATLAAQSKTVKPGMVTAKCFDGYYHELFNEPEPAPVFELLKTWLDARF